MSAPVQSRVIGIHDMMHYQNLMQSLVPNQLMVMDFTATWCGPCRRIAPFYDALSLKFPGVVFTKVDVDELPELSAHYQVSAMPTFKFVANNHVLTEITGANAPALQETLARLLAPPPQMMSPQSMSTHSRPDDDDDMGDELVLE